MGNQNNLINFESVRKNHRKIEKIWKILITKTTLTLTSK